MTQVTITDLKPKLGDFKADVLEGLKASPKKLSPMYFYDQTGSQIFDEICQLPEYYPTRTETAILKEQADILDETLGNPCVLIEYGSGSSIKIEQLLKNSKKIATYVPIDISFEHLKESVHQLAESFPNLPIEAYCANYNDPEAIEQITLNEAHQKTIFFPGSTLGNLETEEAIGLLSNAKKLIGSTGKIILGTDLLKDPDRLIAAYDDASGVTARFNLNLLERINREVDHAFDLNNFKHEARFNSDKKRMEMHLVARRAHEIEILGTNIKFAEGESIHTECSHKYNREILEEICTKVGMSIEQFLTDKDEDFAVTVLAMK